MYTILSGLEDLISTIICPFSCAFIDHLHLQSNVISAFWALLVHTIFFHDSGDTDAVLPVTSTRYSIDALKLPTVSPWRPWYDDGQVISCPDFYVEFIILDFTPLGSSVSHTNFVLSAYKPFAS